MALLTKNQPPKNRPRRQWPVQDPVRGLPYSLGDMPAEDGESFRFGLEPLATRVTLSMVDQLSLTPTYRLLTTLLPSDKVALYFEKRVRNEIFPVMRALYAAQWHRKTRSYEDQLDEVVWQAHQGLGPLLQAFWPSGAPPLTLGSTRNIRESAIESLRRWYRKFRYRTWQLQRVSSQRGQRDLPEMSGPAIAVHYLEGVDETRRSDMFWYTKGVVDPRRILVYFDTKVPKHGGNPVPHDVLDQLNAWGVNYVTLDPRVVEGGDAPFWAPTPGTASLLPAFKRQRTAPHGPAESWVAREAEQILGDVDYWVSFYQRFNVKAHIDMEVGSNRNIAQNIALDLTDGARIGWQRSEFLTGHGHQLGYHPHHVYFAWNARGAASVENSRSRIGSVIVSGLTSSSSSYSNSECEELKAEFAATGATFIVALFDNLTFRDDIYSKAMMQEFYTVFLEWVLEDLQAAVVTKSKKPAVFEYLQEIHPLMTQAQATGRWVNLTDMVGRLPTDASRIADLSVGIGISSAVTEAVAACGRGIHCDLPAMRSHPFYAWGYEKVVFDDPGRMMRAIQRYKHDRSSEPELGDFSSAMDQVDPFHDGRRGERVGSYLRWLMEAFEKKTCRDAAIQYANERYRRLLGEDKVWTYPTSG